MAPPFSDRDQRHDQFRQVAYPIIGQLRCLAVADLSKIPDANHQAETYP
jgi:hypothetical protein